MRPAPERPGAAPLSEALFLRGRAEAAAIPELRGQVVAYAKRVGAGETVRENVRLAVSEAVTNCVVHAYPNQDPGEVTVEAWVGEDGKLIVLVLDEGSGFRTVPQNPGLGVGLGLMAQMADGLSIGTRDDLPGTSVTLRFGLLDGAAPPLHA